MIYAVKGVIPLDLDTTLSIPLGNTQMLVSQSGLCPGNSWNVQRHCNAEWEFHYICKGTCRVDLDKGHFLLKEGQALLIEPGLYHQAKATTGEFQRFTLRFNLPAGSVYQQLAQIMQLQPVFSPGEKIRRMILQIQEELPQNKPFRSTYLTGLIYCLAVELVRFLGIDSYHQITQQQTGEVLLTQEIDTYFEQHFADPCGEEVLAKQLHISRRHLVRILQKHYAMSFREKLIQARMDYATFLLRTTDQTVSDIACQVGYGSESAFFKVFRSNFSMTPLQYRKQYKK